LAFRLATARRPREAELKFLTQGFQRILKQYRADPKAARQLVSMGERPARGDFDVVELAAYTGLASVVLNLDEVISRE
jgi:hypothetical protein